MEVSQSITLDGVTVSVCVEVSKAGLSKLGASLPVECKAELVERLASDLANQLPLLLAPNVEAVQLVSSRCASEILERAFRGGDNV